MPIQRKPRRTVAEQIRDARMAKAGVEPRKPCITSATQPHDVTCWRCAPEVK